MRDADTAGRHNAARALATLAVQPLHQERIARLGVLGPLGALLGDPTAAVREQATVALCCLALHPANRAPIARSPQRRWTRCCALLHDDEAAVR